MTGSAKQPKARVPQSGLLRRFAARNDDRGLLQFALRAAPQSAWTRARGGPATLRHHARDDGSVIAIDLLQQTAAADRQIVMHFRRMQMKPVVVDHVYVRLLAGRDYAAIVDTDRKRGLARPRTHHKGDRQFFAALAVP